MLEQHGLSVSRCKGDGKSGGIVSGRESQEKLQRRLLRHVLLNVYAYCKVVGIG